MVIPMVTNRSAVDSTFPISCSHNRNVHVFGSVLNELTCSGLSRTSNNGKEGRCSSGNHRNRTNVPRSTNSETNHYEAAKGKQRLSTRAMQIRKPRREKQQSLEGNERRQDSCYEEILSDTSKRRERVYDVNVLKLKKENREYKCNQNGIGKLQSTQASHYYDGYSKDDDNSAQQECSTKRLPTFPYESPYVQLTAIHDDCLAKKSGKVELQERGTSTTGNSREMDATPKASSPTSTFFRADFPFCDVAFKKPSFRLKASCDNRNNTKNRKSCQRRVNSVTNPPSSIVPVFSAALYNFMWLTTVFLTCSNYCDKVQGEVLLSKGQESLSKNISLMSVHFDRGETISLRLPLASMHAESLLPPSPPTNGHLKDQSTSGLALDADANKWVDHNNSIYSASDEKLENKRKNFASETVPSSTFAKKMVRELLSQPLERVDKPKLLRAVWDALTVKEIQSIFGHQESSGTHASFKRPEFPIPNFDITRPTFSRLPRSRHGWRRRRSLNKSVSCNKLEGGTEINSDQTSNKHFHKRSNKIIRLDGFGRHFTLNVHVNPNLLDPYFVHLHRHENRSEILPHELARKQLRCFYHGTATHQGTTEADAEEGIVALSLCGGMSGFIIPGSQMRGVSGDNPQFHYVIHPLPNRLVKSSFSSNESANREHGTVETVADREPEDRHHIIIRRSGSPFPKLLQPSFTSSSLNAQKSIKLNILHNDNSHHDHETAAYGKNAHESVKMSTAQFKGDEDRVVPTCMHHDTAFTTMSNDKSSRLPYDFKIAKIKNGNKPRRRYQLESHNTEQQQDHESGADAEPHDEPASVLPNADAETQKVQQNRKKSIILAAALAEPRINDRESLTDEERMKLLEFLSSPPSDQIDNGVADIGSTGHHFRRSKRSTIANFDTETIDPFTYKPLNIAPDSYWLRFRDRSGPLSNSNGKRLSSQFSYDGGKSNGPLPRFSSTSNIDSSSQPSHWPQNNFRVQNANGGSSHRYLASRPPRGSRYFEIPASPEYDDTGVAGTDMTWSKGVLVFESSASVEDRHYPGKDVPFYTKTNAKNRRPNKGITTSSSVVSSTSSTSAKASSTNTRSFDWFSKDGGPTDSGNSASTGPTWISLDKNRTASKQYSLLDTPSRKGRRDDGVFGDKWKSSLDSEILWADRSNEINKQSRFEDLSNVKDRPHSHLTIETAVFVDKDLYGHMQQNFPDDTQREVTRIVLAMINAVQLLYQDPSLGHRVDFVLKRLEVLETDPPTLVRPYDIDRFLTNFCKWQKTENPVSDADPLHWDHALILTGLDLYVVHQSGKISNQVVGLAPVAGMCTRSSSCTVNEGRHFESVFVMAHEIGHNLGMRHDGPQAENNCDPTSHIMSPTLGSGKITWSPCSKKYLDLFLETPQAKCLFDKAKSDHTLDHDADGRLPGERFDADRQCLLKYGRGSFHAAATQPLEDVCRDLHCRREFFTWTSHPALDGTKCSDADDMWCRAGKCVPKRTGSLSPPKPYHVSEWEKNSDKNDRFSGSSNILPESETAAYVTQKTLDGGWGKWSPFTDCSSTCLYSDDGTLSMGSTGIRLAARRCDSPRPDNGGRQCSGADRRYKTCSANKICVKHPTRTTVSQYATEVCSRAAQVDTELTGRGYMSSSNDPERACSVWCETNDNQGPRSRGWSFPDGTACNLVSLPKSANTFCAAGKCQEFACNPYSHFRLSEDDCAFTASNNVVPNSNTKSNIKTWFEAGVKINHRSGKVGWTDWEAQTDCKLACLAPSKGLQLVKRQCASDDALCTGLSLSVRLCRPEKYSVQTNGCTRLQTPFEYATKVCSKYSEKVTGLSGIGMQLSPTKEDSDRPCRIGCQDASVAYRFYMVNGEEGWFPAGTDCSRGDQNKKAYCMAGKCVDFGDDDTLLYELNTNLMGSLFQQSTRSKRQAVYNILEPLKTQPGMDESSLKQLVHKFSKETGNYPAIVQTAERGEKKEQYRKGKAGVNSIDFANPILISTSSSMINRYSGRSLDLGKSDWDQSSSGRQRHYGRVLSSDFGSSKSHPIEGSFYEWRKIMSDCSVDCGTGIQEVIVQCVSGDTVVNDSLCYGRPRPGYSGYITCQKTDCARSQSSYATNAGKGNRGQGSIWNWIQSILPPKQ